VKSNIDTSRAADINFSCLLCLRTEATKNWYQQYPSVFRVFWLYVLILRKISFEW